MSITNTIGLVKNLAISKVHGAPYKVNFMVTSACNSRCTTCNIWKEFGSNPGMLKDELDYGEIVKIFKRLPKTVSWLSITGGEPFLRKDIYNIIRAAITYIPNLRLIGMPSNGLSQKNVLGVIKKLTLIRHPDIIITFSIDGPEHLHDEIRGVKGGFRRTWDTYRKAKRIVREDSAFQIAIETTISSKNIAKIAPFIQKLLEHDHKVAVTIAHDAFLYKNIADKSLSPRGNPEELDEIIDMFKSHLSLFNPQTVIETKYLNKIPVFLANPNRQVVPCQALKSSFALTSTGDVIPCLMWGKKMINIRDCDYDITKLWKSNKFKAVRKIIKEEGCPNCWTPCEAYQSIISAMMKGRIFI